jgi:hypothetical protein
MRKMMINELETNPSTLIPILNYDGMPITADAIKTKSKNTFTKPPTCTMSYLKPLFRHPKLPKNKLGYTLKEYEGSLSTLCAGCGHDSISAAIVQACFELSIEPHKVAKISGIGCSSKTQPIFSEIPTASTPCTGECHP